MHFYAKRERERERERERKRKKEKESERESVALASNLGNPLSAVPKMSWIQFTHPPPPPQMKMVSEVAESPGNLDFPMAVRIELMLFILSKQAPWNME